jgi:uncharacterized protein (DUF1800 family)
MIDMETMATNVRSAGSIEPPANAAGSSDRRYSRRGLLTGAAVLASMWRAAESRATPPTDVSSDTDPSALLNKLVRRITLGFNTTEQTLANQLGYSAYLERQLDYTNIDDSALATRLAGLTTLNMTPLQMYQTANSGLLSNELSEATMLRGIFSNRQLYERMVEFWTDHFNIDITKEPCNFLKSTDDRDVIRANALGSFPALLSASAHSPAMLTYLDNQLSTAAAPNENYGREIMELHTLGADGPYTQADVLSVAKCFSGWSYTPYRAATPDPLSGQFRFDSSRHTTGPKTVLGQTVNAGGISDGVAVLNILATHPTTAKYVSKKMARWFLGESVPQGVIDSVAATYMATGGDIKAMLRTLLSPNSLADAPAKYKRPYHLLVSALRALPNTVTSTSSLRVQLTTMGHRSFYWSTPDGYPDNIDYWVGLILPRWNYGAQLLNGNVAGASVGTAAFFSGLTTAQQLVDKIDQAMFGGEMPLSDKNRIKTYATATPTNATTQQEAIGLAIGSPGFQWY